MSDHRCQINFSCSWRQAFDFSKNSLMKIGAKLEHPLNGMAYYFPPDGSDRIAFDENIENIEGGVQFWINANSDIYVSWRGIDGVLRFEFDLKGKSISIQEKIVGTLYVGLRTEGINLVGDGEVMSIVFFDEN